MPRITDIRPRRGTAALWASTNPVLAAGEIRLETDTNQIKFGDGVTAWNYLPYFGGSDGGIPYRDDLGAWAGWRDAIANMANEPIRWMAIGDSITEGTGSTGGHPNGWVYKTAQTVRTAYPGIAGNAVTGSLGWIPITQTSSSIPAVWVAAANAGSFNSASSFGFRHTKSTAITNGATLTATVKGTHMDIWWTQGTSTTAFTVKVDGATVATLGGLSGSVTSGFNSRVTLGSSANHTVVITAGSGSSFINGTTVFDGNTTSGLVTINAGVHGYKTTEWNTAAAHANWKQDYTALRPHLITVMLGANDYSSLIGEDAFRTNLTNIVQSLRDNTVTTVWPTIVLMSCYKEDYTFDPRWPYYEWTMEQVARDMHCAFVDLRTMIPDPGTAAATAGAYFNDQIHPNNTGYAKIATEMSKLLLARALPLPQPA